jgi:endonuclease/exonuclease/phosphatase family metal-dependent hydrolase
MPGFSIVSFNAAVQDVRLLGRSVYRPVEFPAERLRVLPRALLELDADVVCLQELFQRRCQDWLRAALRQVYPHAAGLASAWPGLRLGNELLVLSRFPVSRVRLRRFTAATPEELRFTSRGFLELVVQVPAFGEITLLNIHASAGGAREHPESPVMEDIRARQIAEFLDHGMSHRRLMVVGDLNAGPQSSIGNYRQVLAAGLVDACAEAGIRGVTWDPANPLVASGGDAHLPPQRIDHVFLNRELAEQAACASARVVFAERRVQTPRGALPLSDHYAVRAELVARRLTRPAPVRPP